jgi:type III secretory pathway component EscR
MPLTEEQKKEKRKYENIIKNIKKNIEANKEKLKEQKKEYDEKNKEKIKEYKKNIEKIKKRTRKKNITKPKMVKNLIEYQIGNVKGLYLMIMMLYMKNILIQMNVSYVIFLLQVVKV